MKQEHIDEYEKNITEATDELIENLQIIMEVYTKKITEAAARFTIKTGGHL